MHFCFHCFLSSFSLFPYKWSTAEKGPQTKCVVFIWWKDLIVLLSYSYFAPRHCRLLRKQCILDRYKWCIAVPETIHNRNDDANLLRTRMRTVCDRTRGSRRNWKLGAGVWVKFFPGYRAQLEAKHFRVSFFSPLLLTLPSSIACASFTHASRAGRTRKKRAGCRIHPLLVGCFFCVWSSFRYSLSPLAPAPADGTTRCQNMTCLVWVRYSEAQIIILVLFFVPLTIPSLSETRKSVQCKCVAKDVVCVIVHG